MAIIMERRLLLYTARGAGGGVGEGGGCTPSLSEKLMIRYHKTRDGHVKMEWPPIQFPSAFILIVRSLALIPGMHHTHTHTPNCIFQVPESGEISRRSRFGSRKASRSGIWDLRKQTDAMFSGGRK